MTDNPKAPLDGSDLVTLMEIALRALNDSGFFGRMADHFNLAYKTEHLGRMPDLRERLDTFLAEEKEQELLPSLFDMESVPLLAPQDLALLTSAACVVITLESLEPDAGLAEAIEELKRLVSKAKGEK